MISDVLPTIKDASYGSAAQILLYRFISASNVQDRKAFSEGLITIYRISNEGEKKEIRRRVAGKDGLLGAFEKESDSEEMINSMFRNLRSLLGSSSQVVFTSHDDDNFESVLAFSRLRYRSHSTFLFNPPR